MLLASHLTLRFPTQTAVGMLAPRHGARTDSSIVPKFGTIELITGVDLHNSATQPGALSIAAASDAGVQRNNGSDPDLFADVKRWA